MTITILLTLLSPFTYGNLDEKIEDFFKKDSVKILVTDSGLGGMSVTADVAARMEGSGVFNNVEVIFFNAQPHEKSGYNSLKSAQQKITIFNNALNAMEENFQPDLILIACNTLSVIYEYTEYSKLTDIPVIGIVGTGVDLIKNRLDRQNDSKVLLFATKTTVNQDKHREGLKALGISSDKIIAQACPKLAGRIERGPESDTTKALVKKYVNEILARVQDPDTSLYVSYNCTHYGYVDDLFRKEFMARGIRIKEFLNPNPLMADFIFTENYIGRYKSTTVNVKIVSQPELSPGKLGAIYGLIESVSEKTADALMEYEYNPNYFEWKSIAENNNE